MEIRCHSSFKKLGKIAESLVNGNGKINALLSDAVFMCGPASDPAYGIPANARFSPSFVGDAAYC